MIRSADLVWLKVPASNAPLAALLAAAARKPRFGYVAGSAADVVAGQQRRGLARIGAGIVGLAYDGLGRLSSVGGDRVVVGRRLGGGGIVTSLVEPDEIRSTTEPDVASPRPATSDSPGPGGWWTARASNGCSTGLAILAAAPRERGRRHRARR